MNETKYTTILSGTNRSLLKNRDTGSRIPADEPVFVLRAQDKHAVPTLKDYLKRCKNPDHAKSVRANIKRFAEFKRNNADRIKEPD